jgi:hypothetical protein
MAARPTTLFGQLRNGVISNNQQRTRNRMTRARNNPGAPGTPRAQMFQFTRNLVQAASRKRSRSGSRRSRSRSGSKKRKSSH